MKFGTPLPEKKARIEIIPLIDIMFFLLASFMMASLTMIRLQSIKMDLPSSVAASRSSNTNMINLRVDKLGDFTIEKKPYNSVELRYFLSNRFRLDTNMSVYINGANDARHGLVIHALDLVRAEGIQRVSFAITPQPTK